MTAPAGGAQLRLDFPRIDPQQRPLITAGAYAAPLAALSRWRSWPDGRLALVGAKGSGRSRLARAWAAETGAAIVTGDMLAAAEIDEISSLSVQALAVDDADGGETGLGLLAALNLCARRGAPVLLTGRPDPGRWHADPPDLVSRLVATGQVQIEEPDDAMLALRLVEALAVRRLSAPEASIRYIAERLERRWTAVEEAADAIERSDAKAVTLPAARRVLAELGREQG